STLGRYSPGWAWPLHASTRWPSLAPSSSDSRTMSESKLLVTSERHKTSTRRSAANATTPRRRVRGVRHDDKHTAILRAAARLFADNGYEATSLDMIADQLGMHKATLYHYVDSKESILYQCLVLSFGDLDEVMKSMADRSVAPLERLRMFCRSLASAQNSDFGRC